MNDPGLDDPIAEDAKDVNVEHQKKDEKDEKEEDEQAFLEPWRVE
jgi:potassium channel subfamily K